MYIGVTVPWPNFDQAATTGITWPRLLALGLLVLAFRRIPALLACYRMMPHVVRSWKEAVFMGYFGPIGVGAIYYLEHTTIVLLGVANPSASVQALLKSIGPGKPRVFPRPLLAYPPCLSRLCSPPSPWFPVVYFLALFSIVVHGLSIPILNCVYGLCGVRPVTDDTEPIRRRSVHVATPNNAVAGDRDTFIAFNRFTRPDCQAETLPTVEPPRREAPHKPQFSSVVFEIMEEKSGDEEALSKPKACVVTCNEV